MEEIIKKKKYSTIGLNLNIQKNSKKEWQLRVEMIYNSFKKDFYAFYVQHVGCGPRCPHLVGFYQLSGIIANQLNDKDKSSIGNNYSDDKRACFEKQVNYSFMPAGPDTDMFKNKIREVDNDDGE